ncbi:MAG: type II toxin-antitoxin system Phd/YefM family antitoxin [Caldilineaceae bacterium]
MDQVLPTQPISNFRQSQSEILELLEQGPVVLTHHGTAAGVLLSVAQYNTMVKLIRRYDDMEIIRKRLHEMEVDAASWQSMEEFEQGLYKRGLIDA